MARTIRFLKDSCLTPFSLVTFFAFLLSSFHASADDIHCKEMCHQQDAACITSNKANCYANFVKCLEKCRLPPSCQQRCIDMERECVDQHRNYPFYSIICRDQAEACQSKCRRN